MNLRIVAFLLGALFVATNASNPCAVEQIGDATTPPTEEATTVPDEPTPEEPTPCSRPFKCFFKWLFSLFGWSIGNRQLLSEARRLVVGIPHNEAFANMRDDFVWPTPSSIPDMISSTFGPRKKFSSGGRYDWHRGVDINGNEGEEVWASYYGIVVKNETVGAGGLTIILEHTFNDPQVHFHGKQIDLWYSVYNHLSAFDVGLDDQVEAGDLIGRVGNTGVSNFFHLHHEVRIGSRCSLQWALENPTSGCNTLDFDPHVHPLYIYPSSAIPCSDKAVALTQPPSGTQDAQVTVTTVDHGANVNRYHVQIIDGDGTFQTLVKEHTLDLNLRSGFDASSVETLDTQETSVPYLAPRDFLTLSDTWVMDFVIPQEWVGASKPASWRYVVTLTSIWDNSETITFGEGVSW